MIPDPRWELTHDSLIWRESWHYSQPLTGINFSGRRRSRRRRRRKDHPYYMGCAHIGTRGISISITWFPNLHKNHDLIPDPWRESDFVWWTTTTTTTRRFRSLYRRSLRLHLMEQGGRQFSNLPYAHSLISRMFQCLPTYKGLLKNISKWPTKMADITIRIQVIPDPRRESALAFQIWRESWHDSRPLMGIF